MGDDLGLIFWRLFNECAWLHVKWREYVRLFGVDEARIELLNKTAPGFFRLVEDSLFEDVVLHIARLTDPERVGSSGGRATLTVQRLPKLVAEAIRPEVGAKLTLALEVTAFARDWRNRHVAHLDLHLALDQGAEPLAHASRQSVRTGLDSITDLLNIVETHYRGGPVEYAAVGYEGDADSLVYFLKKGLEAQAAELELDN